MEKNKYAPKVSVIMPVYNCAEYLDEAISSILLQTYSDFELIAINDGSTDDSEKILKKFAETDNRIRIINQKNSGIVKTLNRGINQARGEYIARMDGDDVSFLNRFYDQVRILDKKQGVVLVAGNFEVIDQNSEFLYRELVFPDDKNLRRAFFLRNAIAHGSTMFRKDIAIKAGLYSNNCGPTEDLDLWMRLLDFGKFEATNSPLYKWRMNQGGITLSNNNESIRQSKKHFENIWSIRTPEYLTRKNILNQGNRYLEKYGKHGVYYKERFIIDTCQIAVKMFKYGQRAKALKQLITVASTGRTGLKYVIKRLSLVINGRIATN